MRFTYVPSLSLRECAINIQSVHQCLGKFCYCLPRLLYSLTKMPRRSSRVCPIFSFMIFLHFLRGSWGFNCDLINSGHYCLCAQNEPGSWDIQCPAKIMEVYPLTLQISVSPMDPEEASLRIICDPERNDFSWRLAQGMDLEHDNVTFSVTSLGINYCPVIPAKELEYFLQQIRLDPLDIQAFSYQTWKSNTSFPPNFFSIMPNLDSVDLINNHLREFPDFRNLTQMRKLILRGNLFSALEEPVFPDSLLFLDLADNAINSLSKKSLANLQKLKVLYLSNNPLEHVDRHSFSNLSNLVELSLDYSRINSLPELNSLSKLTNLSISYSLFSSTQLVPTTTSLPPDEDLNVTKNEANTNFYLVTTTTIVNEEERMTMTTRASNYSYDVDELIRNDEVVERSKNNLESEKNEKSIRDLYSLRKLILINDDLKSIWWIGYLPNLTELVLSKNQIQTIPVGFLRNLPSLMYLDVTQNAISHLTEMDAPILTYLDLSNNYIRMLDRFYFRQLKQLRVLNLASNKIEYIHPLAFESLENLSVLDLSHNLISFESSPQAIPMQRVLIEETTPVTANSSVAIQEETEDEVQSDLQSPLQFLKKIERINLRNNLIKKLFMDWTFVPTNLKILDLSYNRLTALRPRDLYFVSQDVRFDVRYNKISDIDMDFAEVLLEPLQNKNIVVLLDGNPQHCDCRALAFKNFAVKSYDLQYSDLRCASPESLKGIKFSQVPARELKCTVQQFCPTSCLCWEIPSENIITIECKNLQLLTHQSNTISSFMETYQAYNFEVEVKNRNLRQINETEMKGIIPEIRLINLTNTGLTSLNFLANFDPFNNVTQFALSQNTFNCDGCHFQKLWWKNYRRIIDIKNITCTRKVVGDGDSSLLETVTFQDFVRNPVCKEDALNDEIRLILVILAILIPVIIAAIACITRLETGQKKSKSKHSAIRTTDSIVGVGTIGSYPPRPYGTTRSRVADMDNSNF